MTLATPLASAQAESLQCSGGSVGEGESLLNLSQRCGPPAAQASRCEPVVMPPQVPVAAQGGMPNWSQPIVIYNNAPAPCVQIDEWLYDRGPGNLPATVRMRSGVVQSIHYGR